MLRSNMNNIIVILVVNLIRPNFDERTGLNVTNVFAIQDNTGTHR